MLLVLRSLYEAPAIIIPPALGGAWGAPRVNFAEFYKPEQLATLVTRRKVSPALVLALYASGQIDLPTFAALLAAPQE